MTVPYTGTHVVARCRSRTCARSIRCAPRWKSSPSSRCGSTATIASAVSSIGATRRCWPASTPATIAPASPTELELHGLVFEASGHKLLQRAWHGLRGRLQLYWAAHHRAHGMRGPRRDSHDSYIKAALGSDLDVLRLEDRRPHAPRRGGHGEVRFGGIEEEEHDMTINRRKVLAGTAWGLAAGSLAVAARARRHHRGDQEARHLPRRASPRRRPDSPRIPRPASGRRVSASPWARRWPMPWAPSSRRSR